MSKRRKTFWELVNTSEEHVTPNTSQEIKKIEKITPTRKRKLSKKVVSTSDWWSRTIKVRLNRDLFEFISGVDIWFWMAKNTKEKHWALLNTINIFLKSWHLEAVKKFIVWFKEELNVALNSLDELPLNGRLYEDWFDSKTKEWIIHKKMEKKLLELKEKSGPETRAQSDALYLKEMRSKIEAMCLSIEWIDDYRSFFSIVGSNADDDDEFYILLKGIYEIESKKHRDFRVMENRNTQLDSIPGDHKKMLKYFLDNTSIDKDIIDRLISIEEKGSKIEYEEKNEIWETASLTLSPFIDDYWFASIQKVWYKPIVEVYKNVFAPQIHKIMEELWNIQPIDIKLDFFPSVQDLNPTGWVRTEKNWSVSEKVLTRFKNICQLLVTFELDEELTSAEMKILLKEIISVEKDVHVGSGYKKYLKSFGYVVSPNIETDEVLFKCASLEWSRLEDTNLLMIKEKNWKIYLHIGLWTSDFNVESLFYATIQIWKYLTSKKLHSPSNIRKKIFNHFSNLKDNANEKRAKEYSINIPFLKEVYNEFAEARIFPYSDKPKEQQRVDNIILAWPPWTGKSYVCNYWLRNNEFTIAEKEVTVNVIKIPVGVIEFQKYLQKDSHPLRQKIKHIQKTTWLSVDLVVEDPDTLLENPSTKMLFNQLMTQLMDGVGSLDWVSYTICTNKLELRPLRLTRGKRFSSVIWFWLLKEIKDIKYFFELYINNESTIPKSLKGKIIEQYAKFFVNTNMTSIRDFIHKIERKKQFVQFQGKRLTMAIVNDVYEKLHMDKPTLIKEEENLNNALESIRKKDEKSSIGF